MKVEGPVMRLQGMPDQLAAAEVHPDETARFPAYQFLDFEFLQPVLFETRHLRVFAGKGSGVAPDRRQKTRTLHQDQGMKEPTPVFAIVFFSVRRPVDGMLYG